MIFINDRNITARRGGPEGSPLPSAELAGISSLSAYMDLGEAAAFAKANDIFNQLIKIPVEPPEKLLAELGVTFENPELSQATINGTKVNLNIFPGNENAPEGKKLSESMVAAHRIFAAVLMAGVMQHNLLSKGEKWQVKLTDPLSLVFHWYKDDPNFPRLSFLVKRDEDGFTVSEAPSLIQN